MAKRIVKREIKEKDRTVTFYMVESNRLFGFIPTKWHIINYVTNPDRF